MVERAERNSRSYRLSALVASIREYDPHIKREDLELALAWSARRFKSPRVTTINDLFSDPLLIAEELVRLVKADRTTILAAILYPAVRPHDGVGVDRDGLKEIDNMFKEESLPRRGSSVRKLVERTLRLRSLDHQNLKQGASQKKEEQLHLFNLMSIWMAEDPRAIAIRVTQRLLNIRYEGSALRGQDREKERENVIWQARMIGAPTVYLAQYASLRTNLLKEAYLLEDPEGYARTKKRLDYAGSSLLTHREWDLIQDVVESRHKEPAGYDFAKRQLIESKKLTERQWAEIEHAVENRKNDTSLYQNTLERFTVHGGTKVTDIDLENIREQIIAHISSSTRLLPDMFDVKVRRKDPASTLAKTTHKKKTIEEMGDQFGFRVVLKVADRQKNPDFNVDKLQPEERDQLMTEASGNIMHIYAKLSKKFGRGARRRDTVIDAAYQHLAEIDPHPLIPNMDDRRDDYIGNPKPSGYSALQDAFFFKVNGRAIEFEGQIVDEIRHDNNMYGPRAGRVYYKTGLADHADVVVDFYRHAAAVMAGERPSLPHVIVFDHLNQIHVLPEKAKVSDFATHLCRLHPNAGLEDMRIVKADIKNQDPFLGNRYDVKPNRCLRTGDQVFLVLKA